MSPIAGAILSFVLAVHVLMFCVGLGMGQREAITGVRRWVVSTKGRWRMTP